jgi:hypothetical protein
MSEGTEPTFKSVGDGIMKIGCAIMALPILIAVIAFFGFLIWNLLTGYP